MNEIALSKPMLANSKDIARILKSGNLSNGSYTRKFEKEFAKFCRARNAIASTNGTSALHTVLSCFGLKKKEVIVPAFSFVATANMILAAGLKPKFVDISETDYCIDADKVNITKDTGAVLGVSLYGQIFDFHKIPKKVPIIEDAAQSVGAKAFQFKSGDIGDASCFSFYATKNMTTGEGGMITTNNKKLAEAMRMFTNHGSEYGSYDFKFVGYNYRMTEIQAALGLEQLKIIDQLNEERKMNAEYFNHHLRGINGLTLPFEKPRFHHVYHQYVVLVDKNKYGMSRDELMTCLRCNNIQAKAQYPFVIPNLPFYKKFKGKFPIACKVAKTNLAIPVHPYLTKEDLKKIVKIIK